MPTDKLHLLMAFPLDNPRASVLYAGAYSHTFTPRLRVLMQDRPAGGGASLWFDYNGRLTRR